VDEQDPIPGQIENEQTAEVRTATPKATVGDWESQRAGAGPAPIPPGHINVGADSFLGTDPVTGAVTMDDWGPIPGGEPDMEHSAVSILDEDATP